jgi:hypothetical protein
LLCGSNNIQEAAEINAEKKEENWFHSFVLACGKRVENKQWQNNCEKFNRSSNRRINCGVVIEKNDKMKMVQAFSISPLLGWRSI